jgi:membrane-associated phospholipid phosphatase
MANLIELIINELASFWRSFTAHIVEWVFTIVLIGGAIGMGLVVEPKEDRAVFENFNERYPYSGETIGVPILFIIIIVIPCGILGLLAVFLPKTFDLCLAYMSLAQVLGITLLMTECLKIFVARPRPNYFSYCDYDEQSKICRGPRSHQRDAKVSFPSGHASNAFACGTWVCLFMGNMSQSSYELWWILLRFLPLAIATFIACTRITDYMHHVSDVVGGCVLGVGVAIVVYSSQATRIFVNSKKKVVYDTLGQL